ncbi:MAG: transposase [Candidatus Thiodiazotropha sp.]
MAKRTRGKVLGEDFRKLIINKVSELGGDTDSGSTPRGVYQHVSKQLGIDHHSVKHIWIRFCVTKSYKPLPHSGGRKGKLQQDHIRFIHYLKRETPSITNAEIKEKLLQFGNVDVSIMAISRVLKKKLGMTRKVLVRPAAERFTIQNMRYTQAFIDTLSRLDVNKIKFFDESGFSYPEVCNPTRGHSLKGERAIEIKTYTKRPNVTLNLLISVNGVSYANVLQGASNTDTYMQFVTEAVNATTNTGEYCLKPGDYLIVDNCPIHRNRAEQVLAPFLARLGIEYIFTPTYSPNMNPAEYCFQHIKTLFKTKDFAQLAQNNLEYAIMRCVNEITPMACRGYFQHVGYLRV